MKKTKIFADANLNVGAIDRHIFGSFIEHLGRAVYEGIYEPGHPAADENGFRKDVIGLIKELNVPIVRYPGGNFLSGYDWRDGIGPKEKRPVRLDLAWFSTETNEFGTDEFMKWCRIAGIEPMMAVNMGTGTILDAARLVEYCNHPGGTTVSEMRRANGADQPYNVEYWCIGNEMDGPWQIGHLTAEEYGRKALEAAKVMRWANGEMDGAAGPNGKLKLIVSGSSNHEMPTFPEWDRTVLEHTYKQIDLLSMHRYYMYSASRKRPLEDFLGSADDMSEYIGTLQATIEYVRAKERSQKRVGISFDGQRAPPRTALETRAAPVGGRLYLPGCARVCGADEHAAQPLRRGQNGLPCAARQRHCAHHDGEGRQNVPSDLLLSLPRHCEQRERQDGARDLRFGYVREHVRAGTVYQRSRHAR